MAPVIAGTAHCSSFSWLCARATPGGVAALGSAPEDTGTLVSWDTLSPSTLL
jgi:hypothetical protein